MLRRPPPDPFLLPVYGNRPVVAIFGAPQHLVAGWTRLTCVHTAHRAPTTAADFFTGGPRPPMRSHIHTHTHTCILHTILHYRSRVYACMYVSCDFVYIYIYEWQISKDRAVTDGWGRTRPAVGAIFIIMYTTVRYRLPQWNLQRSPITRSRRKRPTGVLKRAAEVLIHFASFPSPNTRTKF